MRIAMLLDHNFPGDSRVEREAAALLEAGHEVFVLFFTSRHNRSQSGYDITGTRLIKIPAPSKPILRAVVKIHYADLFLSEYGRKYGFEAIHVHDLPLWLPAARAAARLNIPLVFDCHENYPGLVASYGRFRIIRAWLWRQYERLAAAKSTAVVTVVEEMAERLLGSAWPGKAIAAPNSADPTAFDAFDPAPAESDFCRRRRVAVYQGTYGKHKGVEVAIRAAARLKDSHPDFGLLIIAESTDPKRYELEAMAQSLGLTDQVEFIGRLPVWEVLSHCRAGYVGLIPQLKNTQSEASWPNKLNELAYVGLPVLASDNKSLKRIIEAGKFGLTFTAGDSDDLAAKLAWLLDHPKEAREMGRWAQIWARTDGSWARHKVRLVEMYDRLARTAR